MVLLHSMARAVTCTEGQPVPPWLSPLSPSPAEDPLQLPRPSQPFPPHDLCPKSLEAARACCLRQTPATSPCPSDSASSLQSSPRVFIEALLKHNDVLPTACPGAVKQERGCCVCDSSLLVTLSLFCKSLNTILHLCDQKRENKDALQDVVRNQITLNRRVLCCWWVYLVLHFPAPLALSGPGAYLSSEVKPSLMTCS